MMNKTLLPKHGVRQLLSMSALVVAAVGLFGSQQALAGIASTKHNLGTGGGGTNHLSTGTAEICVFCHTPHGSDTSAAVPLWNRKLAAANTYTTYNSLGTSSLDGSTAPVGSVSLACLSCHDGAQAMNVMINQPGSGGYAGVTGATANAADVWDSGGVGTLAGATNIAFLGTDLKNDHPIGIEYGGGHSAGAYPASAVSDGAFIDADFKGVLHTPLNGTSVWWVETGGNTTRQKTDMQLYTRTAAAEVTYPSGVRTETAGALTGARAYVECASCHDPHESVKPTFLRIANTGSAVCLACHIK